MSNKGIITREDIFQKEAITAPLEYAANLKIASDLQLQIIELLKQTNQLSKDFKGAKTSKEIIDLKSKEVVLQQKYADLLTKQRRSELEMQKIKEKEISIKNKEVTLLNKVANIRKKAIQLTQKEKLETSIINRLKKEEAILNSNLVGAYQKLNLKRTQSKKALQDLIATGKASNTQLRKAQNEFNRLDQRVKKADRAVGDFTKNVGNYKSAFKGLSGSLRNLVGAFGFTSGLVLFSSLVKGAFNRVKEFDSSMQNLAGILRVNRDELKGLETTIIDVASVSVKTSNEVAKLAESLITLGKTREEVEKLLKPAVDLGIGLKTTSEEAGEFLVQMLNTFGASTDEAGKYADTIATIRTSTSLDFQKMRDSFQYLAPISRALNKDLAYTGSLVGILADNGIKAERAGRLMGTSQQKLASEGKSLNDALNELNEAKATGVSELELLALSSKLFGKQSSALGLVLANNTDLIEKNAQAIRENGGALEDLVNEQLQSLDSHLKILESTWEKYILNTDKSSGASSKLKDGIKFLTENLEKIINTTITLIKWFGIYKLIMIASAGVTKLAVAGNTLYRISLIAMRGGIKKTILAMKALKVATASSGIGLLLVVLGSAYELFSAFSDGANEATDAQKKLNKEIEDFNNAGNEYKKTILSYKKGNEQIGAVMDVQAGILGRVQKNLLTSREKDYQSNAEHVRLAKNLIQETTDNDVQSIRKRIQAKATFSKAQEDYLVREIARYQASEKIAKDNEAYLDKIDEEKSDKQKELTEKQRELNKKQRENQQKLNESLKQSEFELSQDLIQMTIDKNENIINSENATFEEKFKAIQKLKIALNNFNNNQIDEDKRLLKQKLDNNDILQDEYIARLQILGIKSIGINEELENQITENLKKVLGDRLEAQKNSVDENIKAYQAKANAQKKIDEISLEERKKAISLISEFTANAFGVDANNLGNFISGLIDGFKTFEEGLTATLQLAGDVMNTITNISAGFSEDRIAQIDNEIEKNDEKFNNLLANEELTLEQRSLLEAQKQREQDKLEKKKREEKTKQAKLEKAATLAQIVIETSLGIVRAVSLSPLTFGQPFASVVAAIGAVQFALAAARPIPKFKDGHLAGTHQGWAITNDGGKQEILERNGMAHLIQGVNTPIYMQKGDKVYKSEQDYQQRMANNAFKDLNNQQIRVKKAQELSANDNKVNEQYLAFLIGKEMSKQTNSNISKEIKKGFKNVKVEAKFTGSNENTIYKKDNW